LKLLMVSPCGNEVQDQRVRHRMANRGNFRPVAGVVIAGATA